MDSIFPLKRSITFGRYRSILRQHPSVRVDHRLSVRRDSEGVATGKKRTVQKNGPFTLNIHERLPLE